ncbi:hypothetical protein [Halorientalis litorea]|uniref:hypothetical protein n=1 Tax=Halorientalis litorea TaxID=2931977 RepID=UPI001FF37467|nr:hypothetical protein [Halorientalis litorea]
MTDTDTTPTDAPTTGEPTDENDGDSSLLRGRSAVEYLYWGAFATLLVLALLATLRFYDSASRAIRIWIASDWVPVFQAAFNLAVVFGCAIGLSLLVRRMRN